MRKAGIFALLLLGMSALARSGSPALKEIPFQICDGFILMQARTSQSAEPLNFLLDSGAGASVLDLSCAARLRVPLGAPVRIRGVGCESIAYRISDIPATNGDSDDLATISMAVDLSNAEKICEAPVDGLLGVDFFTNHIVQLDFAAHVIRFPANAKLAAKGEKLPIRFCNGMICVPLSVNGSSLRWARFDTGCSDALHWVIPRSRETRVRHGVSIGFVTNEQDQALTSVRLGSRSLEHVETSLHGSPMFPGEAGLLGNGILWRYTVTVDTAGRCIYLQAPSGDLQK